MFDKYPDIVTVAELAQMLRIGRNTAYELVRSGAIPSAKAGRVLRITKPTVIEYFSRQNPESRQKSIDFPCRKR